MVESLKMLRHLRSLQHDAQRCRNMVTSLYASFPSKIDFPFSNVILIFNSSTNQISLWPVSFKFTKFQSFFVAATFRISNNKHFLSIYLYLFQIENTSNFDLHGRTSLLLSRSNSFIIPSFQKIFEKSETLINTFATLCNHSLSQTSETSSSGSRNSEEI